VKFLLALSNLAARKLHPKKAQILGWSHATVCPDAYAIHTLATNLPSYSNLITHLLISDPKTKIIAKRET